MEIALGCCELRSLRGRPGPMQSATRMSEAGGQVSAPTPLLTSAIQPDQ